MSDFVCKHVPVFDVGKKQLEDWISSGVLDNPVYAAFPVYVGDYVIVHMTSSFGRIMTKAPIVWTGYLNLSDAMGKLPPVVEYPQSDKPWIWFGTACEIEVWHVVDDAALYVGMPVRCPVGGTCYSPWKCKAVLKDACPRYRASVQDSLAQLRAAGELTGCEGCGSFDDYNHGCMLDSYNACVDPGHEIWCSRAQDHERRVPGSYGIDYYGGIGCMIRCMACSHNMGPWVPVYTIDGGRGYLCKKCFDRYNLINTHLINTLIILGE